MSNNMSTHNKVSKAEILHSLKEQINELREIGDFHFTIWKYLTNEVISPQIHAEGNRAIALATLANNAANQLEKLYEYIESVEIVN